MALVQESLGFSVADYVIFSLTIAISIGIGIYHAFTGGKQRTASEYLVGNRKMSILPVTLSLIVSFESSIMMLAYPAEVYTYGIMFLLTSLGFMFATLLATKIVVPLIHPLKITSVYELIYMGFVLYGPSLAIEAVTDFPFWASVLCISAASVVYTAIGGIKAVIWTDVFQCLIMFTGVFAVIIKGTIDSGGPREVVDIAVSSGRLNLFNFDPDPTVRHTFWGLVIGSIIRLIDMTFRQATVQRICAVEKQSDANKMLYIAGPAFLITLSLACSEGLVAFAYFTTKGCDPIASKAIRKPDQVLPYMVFHIFKETPGMAGLFMAAVFSASLSTLSSLLNSMAAVTEEDIIKQCFKNISDYKATIAAKISVVFYGVLAVIFTIMIANIEGIISQLSTSFTSAVSGPITGLFLLSVFYPWATKKSAVVGTCVGAALVFWLTLGQSLSKTLRKTQPLPLGPVDQCFANETSSFMVNFNMTDMLYSYNVSESPVNVLVNDEPGVLDRYYSISYLWVSALGVTFTVVSGIIASLIEGLPASDSIDVRFVLPFFDQLFPFIPKRIRTKLYLGVPFEKRDSLLENYGEKQLETDINLLPKTDNNGSFTNKINEGKI
ncbi:Hypothetical predicted protein [Mytilus galloprovincialis]|uniref:Uncharacterized protein n=1 Tax=Mytilus galloprovincialis TaxID=29158 RepID=A0A8B6DRG2_MYTGA|nr:Hypothetical predicted protein [Mytilus galloprovincialis]